MNDYTVLYETPRADTYRKLRKVTGLSPKSKEAAERGLRGTLFAVLIVNNNNTIGMGRLVGDGGCHFQIVDIAVEPDHQGKGVGKMILREITDYIWENLPDSAYVSLIADGPARHLYEKFGFEKTAPASIGMALRVTR